MFSIIRNIEAPDCLLKGDYRHRDVISALDIIFHGKCYLCEQKNLSDPEVEHFKPHRGNDYLRNDWNNLFLACGRCNSIKGHHHIDLMDCSDENVSVFDKIIHLAGNATSGLIDVRPSEEHPEQDVLNTVNLLRECFNNESTGLRGISKEALMEKICVHFMEWNKWRYKLVNDLSLEGDIIEAKAKIKLMCKDAYPFSIFWRWHTITDFKINKKYKNIRCELGF